MRDVTDNVTGELDVEVKRGRGRPRKADAMTNAERQAAYRVRQRQAVTVTKNAPAPRLVVDQVDAYDECRLEVDALRAELAEAHETIDELNDELIPLRAMKARLDEVDGADLEGQLVLAAARRARLDETNERLCAELSRELARADEAVERAEELEDQVERLQKVCKRYMDQEAKAQKAAAKQGAGKSVTRNGNPVSFATMVELLAQATKASTRAERSAIFETSTWSDGVVRADTSDDQVYQVRVAINPAAAKVVTRKPVTKTLSEEEWPFPGEKY